MKLAYLINQYPQPSHSFIRREIAALEALGVPVSRHTLRGYPGPLPDPADQAERENAFVVLDQGVISILSSILWAFVTRPGHAARALRAALNSGWEPSRGVSVRLAYFAEACFLARRFAEQSITHLHAHFGTNSTAVAMLVRLLGGPPYSFTAHGPEEFDRTETLGLGEKIHHSAFAVAISDFGRSQLYRWARTSDWHKIQIIHCGVDQAFLESALTPVPAVPRLLCIGRLSEQKGQLTLIEAAALLAKTVPDFELLLVGDGPMRGDIEGAIAGYDLSRNVRLLGWKSGPEIRDLLLSSRAMVLPSFAEGLPVVIMESLALGRPVISTAVMGIPDLVHPQQTGWLVPPANPEALARAMKECLATDPIRLTEMGSSGRLLVEQHHTALREAERLLGLIRSAEGKEAP
jgi:glycosyltransferase involved in cell wall biosynthesis